MLRGLIDGWIIEELDRQFGREFPEFQKRQGSNGNRGPYRHYMDHEISAPFKGSCLGLPFAVDQFASDTPFEGSDVQDIHSDYERSVDNGGLPKTRQKIVD